MKINEHFELIHDVIDGKVDTKTVIKHQKVEARKPKVAVEPKSEKGWHTEWEEKIEAEEDWRREQRNQTTGKK